MIFSTATKVFLARKPADMRWSFDRLAELVRTTLAGDPLSGHLFVFRNRDNNRVKILFWERTGYWLWYKRLEKGRFTFLDEASQSHEIEMSDLFLFLEGIRPEGLKRLPNFLPKK